METNSNEGTATIDSSINMDASEKMMNTDDEFFDDSAQNSADFDNADNDDGFEQRFQAANRGGFRGRWNAGATSPRFRGRGGFGPNQMGQQIRGRGGPQYFRGGRGGARFPNSGNFDPNWNGPPMYGNSHMGFGNQQGNQQGDQQNAPFHQRNNFNQVELWVETKTDEGKSYYYNAITRETTWTRPEGHSVKIMGQNEVEAMQAAKIQQQQQQQPDQQQPDSQLTQTTLQENTPGTGGNQANADSSESETVQLNGDNKSESNGQANMDASSGSTPNESTKGDQPSPNLNSTTTTQPPPQQTPAVQPLMNMPMQNQAPPPMQQFNTPPPFTGFGMPPPNYMYPPNPWNPMPWQQPIPQIGNDKSRMVDPQILARAAEWSEHRAPDGRPYYYHAIRGESVWEKPQPLKDLEAARMSGHPQPFPPMGAPGMMPPGMGNPAMHAQPIVSNVPFDAMNFKPDKKPEESEEAKLEKKKKEEATKKKKEEEEKAKQAPAKPQDKSRPISSTPIAGTPWCVVWTGDGRVFFYNPSTRTSVWERPEDLVGRADVDKAVSATPSATPDATTTEDSTAATKRSESESSGENEVPNKKPKLVETTTSAESTNAPATATTTPATNATKPIGDKKNDIGKEAAIEAEVRAARERALVPLETRVKQFKDMLKEKDVSAFSTWEKELHKIVFDPRYLLLTSRERKQVFEKYVKERAEEERREKRNKMRQKRDDFRSLMEAANLHGKSSFSDFAQKYGKDEKFKGIEKMRERESLFNEYIVEMRRREKDEKIQKKETIRKDFLALLRECSEITRHSRWADVKKVIDGDKRYRAVESSMLREDYFHDYCKILKEEKRKQKDKERDRKEKKDKDKDKEREKEKDKDKHRDKDRREKGKDGKSKEKQNTSKDEDKSSRNESDKDDQEDGEHQSSSSEDESDKHQKECDRQMRAIVEREKEVQQQLAGHLRNLHKEREHHKRDEAIRHFNALLADLVRNPDLTWKEVKKILRKDSRWESVELLDRENRERIFNDHILQLGKKKRDKFREMLDELTLELTASWKDVKKQIRDDPRYLKYNSSEKCEREFREYIRDKTTEAKVAFKELLQECKLITYKSFETVKENPLHLKEIEDILKNDKRFLILDHIQYDRSHILMNYLEELHKRGPPPPPTASDSSRRK
ncbi:transcription elongation regulator 1 isoform X2 [Sitodiplosis mosellana]|uniref:transcription elongation regulator 1 isoform X2 n=1 Tax=Sitodiplosis mosellana TaxID=263140 RepID=UPI002443CA02|nr:transcription elongation regulator 1 isoform X2 [Sitodiplosis mosellana]XP_055310124.1 transcription elongation regulator 1 isoform X2 [Sitodiplosis mosellana]